MDTGGYLSSSVTCVGLSIIITAAIISHTSTRGEIHMVFTSRIQFRRADPSPDAYYTEADCVVQSAFLFSMATFFN